jgi:hypothetical protein
MLAPADYAKVLTKYQSESSLKYCRIEEDEQKPQRPCISRLPLKYHLHVRGLVFMQGDPPGRPITTRREAARSAPQIGANTFTTERVPKCTPMSPD